MTNVEVEEFLRFISNCFPFSLLGLSSLVRFLLFLMEDYRKKFGSCLVSWIFFDVCEIL